MTEPAVHKPLTAHQQQALAHLRSVVAARAADSPAVSPALPRSRRPRQLVAGAAALVTTAGAVVAGVALSGGGAPAYAVEKLPDGGVRLTVRDPSQLAGLPEQMSDAGVPTKVVPVTRDCPPPRAVQAISPAHRRGPAGMVITENAQGETTLSLFGGERLPKNAVVVIGRVPKDMDTLTKEIMLITTADVTCLPVDGRTLPPLPEPGSH